MTTRLAIVMLAVGMFAVAMPAGCSTPVGSPGKECLANQTFSCICSGDPSGDPSGVQVCNQFGTGLDLCQCGGGAGSAGADAATDGDADGDADAVAGTGSDTGGDTATGDDTGGQASGDDGPCLEEIEKRCVGAEIYWFDSCDEQGELVTDCAAGGCLNGVCQGECTPKFVKKCHNGNPWWFDSCGEPGSGADICSDEQFCVNSSCVKPFYDGNWELTADPNTKPLGVLGSATFPPTIIKLVINGTTATAEVINFPVDVKYTGTLTGKVLKMTAQYSEGGAGSAQHDETVVVTFKDQAKFTGLITDDVSVPDLGPIANLVWIVTGIKQ